MTTNSIKLMAMAACVALSFVSCQNDIDDDSNLVILTPEFQNATMIQTRAMASGDYEGYTPKEGDDIKAFTYDAGHSAKYTEIRSGSFTYTDGKWKSSVGCEDRHNIDIYSIMPADIAAAEMTTNGRIDLGGLKVLSEKDVMYSVAAAKTEGELTTGIFHLDDVKLATKSNPQEDKVWFAMDHLFAKARLYFQCDPDYRELRTIEITKLTAETAQGTCNGSYINFPGTPTVHLGDTFNDGKLEVNMNLPQELSPAGMVELQIAPQLFDSIYVLPGAGVAVTVKVGYNIYDDKGQILTRGGQTASATNIIVPSELEGGKEYDIKVTVKPTYLYVLADVDGELDLTIDK